MKILIVEDELKSRKGLGKLIEKETSNEVVGEADNGKEGLRMFYDLRPDLIFTDVRMPSMDGLEMLEIIRNTGVYVHTVIISGYAEFSYAKKAIEVGVDGYLMKPVCVGDVLKILSEIESKINNENNRVRKTEKDMMDIVENVYFLDSAYPADAEKNIKSALCAHSNAEVTDAVEKFNDFFKRSEAGLDEIRRGYLKYLVYVTGMLKEIDAEAYKLIRNKNAVEKISSSRSVEELENVLIDSLGNIAESRPISEYTDNYIIMRVIAYIREHYSEKITLEMMAAQFRITPEYLSTLFSREMDINFSTFLKRFRISQAKRFIRTSDMRIYEIAKKTGYPDPKYFMRVFHDEMGMSPGEYKNKFST